MLTRSTSNTVSLCLLIASRSTSSVVNCDFRSWTRGTGESDLLIRTFADQCPSQLD
jgi:hypothetical protein